MARFVPVKSPGVFNVPVYRELRAGGTHVELMEGCLLMHQIKGEGLSVTSFLHKRGH